MGILAVPYEKDTVGIRTPLVHKGRYPHLLRFFVSAQAFSNTFGGYSVSLYPSENQVR